MGGLIYSSQSMSQRGRYCSETPSGTLQLAFPSPAPMYKHGDTCRNEHKASPHYLSCLHQALPLPHFGGYTQSCLSKCWHWGLLPQKTSANPANMCPDLQCAVGFLLQLWGQVSFLKQTSPHHVNICLALARQNIAYNRQREFLQMTRLKGKVARTQ